MMGSRRGAAAIEFALVSIVFLTLLFAIMDYGWYFFRRANLQEAVVEAARRGAAIPETSSPGPEGEARRVIEDKLTGMGIDPADASIAAEVRGSRPTKTLFVTASMPYQDLITFIPLPTPDSIGASMSMHLEVQ